jgi:glucan phosphoethanolaminetransferase (alkaline phosphatase superfamily)
MIWLTNLSPSFDVEKRRRWYAACLGTAGATSFLGAFFISEGRGLFQSEEKIWLLCLTLFGFWVLVFLLKYIAGYAIWSRPYTTRKRAIALSLAAMLAVYVGVFGCATLFALFQGRQVSLKSLATTFYTLNKALLGLPYLAAFIVGWCFARPAPDVRDQF